MIQQRRIHMKSNMMKTSLALTLAALPWLFTGCSTPQAPLTFHNTDNSALVIESLDSEKSQMVMPAASTADQNARVLEKARTLPQHGTVVVILENYTEPQLGRQFRDRSTPLFIGLRGLGYEHIFFLQGNGGVDTEGLPLLARYD